MSCYAYPATYHDDTFPTCPDDSTGVCPPCKKTCFRYRRRCCPMGEIAQPRVDLEPTTVALQEDAIVAALGTVTPAEFEANGVTVALNFFDKATIALITVDEDTPAGLTVALAFQSTGNPAVCRLVVAADSPNQPTDLTNDGAAANTTLTVTATDGAASAGGSAGAASATTIDTVIFA